MKIYNKIVLDWHGNVIEEDSYEYEGPVAEAKGGAKTVETKVEESNKLPEWYIPYAQKGLERSSQYLDSPNPTYYPGETVAGMDPALQQGLAGTIAKATQGSPVLPAAENATLNTISGANLYNNPALAGYSALGYGDNYSAGPAAKYLTNTAEGSMLNGNPFMDAMFGQAADQITSKYQTTIAPQITGSAIAGGRYGSGSMFNREGRAQDALAGELASKADDIYYRNYQTERNNQLAAANSLQGAYNQGQQVNLAGLGGASSAYDAERARQEAATASAADIAAGQYTDLNQLISAGTALTQDQQNRINADIARHDFGQNAELNKLASYMGLISGDYGGEKTGTSTQPVQGGK